MKTHDLALLLFARSNDEIPSTVNISIPAMTSRVYGWDCTKVVDAGTRMILIFDKPEDPYNPLSDYVPNVEASPDRMALIRSMSEYQTGENNESS